MAYREVTMVEIKEVIRLWRAGIKKKRIASQLTLDVKTVARGRFFASTETAGNSGCGVLFARRFSRVADGPSRGRASSK
jgi:hypothetical protein